MNNPNRKRRLRRLLGAVSVATMAFTISPISPISPISAAGASDGNLCPAEGQRDAFTDDEGSVHEDNINCGEALDVINGKTPTTFQPRADLTRGQAASLLVQLIEAAQCGTELTVGPDAFDDDDDSVHEENINKAANNDIIVGFSDGTFRPNEPVTRGQFASIVVQAVEALIGSDLTSDGQDEFDDDDTSVHESNIEKAVDNGFLEGFGNRNFGPRQNIDRAQTATILIRTGEFLFDLEFFHCDEGGAATALVLTPDTDINPVGTPHTVVADLDDAEGDPAAEGTLVRFEVFRDDNNGAAEDPFLFFVTGGFDTATGGTADFTYAGPPTNEQDVIVSCVVADRTSSCVDDAFLTRNTAGGFSNISATVFDTARKEFTQRSAAALVLTPETDINPSGADHTVTATVSDQFGAPDEDTTVKFQVFVDTDFDGNFAFFEEADTVTGGDATENTPPTQVSNQPDGVATFTFDNDGGTGEVNGLFRVVACVESADADDDCATVSATSGPVTNDPQETVIDRADKEFVAAQNAAAGTFTGTVVQDCVDSGGTSAGTVGIFTTDNRFLILTFGGGDPDQFTVGGATATQAGFVAACSVGDTLSSNFTPAPGVQSTFNLTNV